METLIKKIEAQYLKDKITIPQVGDMVNVKIKIKEGEKERIQSYQGLVIAIRGEGINKSIKVRKISYDVGVEKTILIHSPAINDIEILKEGKPRRAKLYYLRKRKGKSALKVKRKINKVEKASKKERKKTKSANKLEKVSSLNQKTTPQKQEPEVKVKDEPKK